jgi:hypothetical protein
VPFIIPYPGRIDYSLQKTHIRGRERGNSLEGIEMSHIEEAQQETLRQKVIEEFRMNRVGLLLHIIEELDDMGLDTMEMDAVLRSCGLDYKCAMKIGAALRDEKEKGYRSPANRKR